MTKYSRPVLPKISVVTPSLNQGQFLTDCLDSIHGQNYPHLEHIIIDGGSKDNTLDIIKKHARHLTYWVSESDKGAADAINKGYRQASGDLVIWLNADDFFVADAFETIAALYNTHPDSPFFFGDGWRVDVNGNRKSNFFPDGRPKYLYEALAFGLDYILQPATFINRRFVRRSELLDPTLRWGFDWELWLHLAQSGTPATTNAVLAASREHEATLTSTGMLVRAEELRTIAARYTGSSLTPGVLCYYLDTFKRAMTAADSRFTSESVEALSLFWREVERGFFAIGADPAGFPLRGSPFGTRFDFSAGGNAGALLGVGWANPESFGTWTTGPRSVIRILTDVPTSDVTLRMRIQPFPYPDGSSQALAIYVNDELIKSMVCCSNQDLAVVVRRETWTRCSPVKIELLHPDARSPRSLGMSEDVRELAFSVPWLVVEASTADCAS